jgi:hypothetical protein
MASHSRSGLASAAAEAASGLRDFDFVAGAWRVQHRRLKERLAGSDEWEEFGGTSEAHLILGGAGNVDDNVIDLPDGTYRAATLRTFDPETRRWSIWWFDGRRPLGPLDPPMVGRFEDGVGTFFANDSLRGRPIVVHFIWSDITERSARWEQAFSPDGGATWEVNWVMEFTRVS